MRSLILTVSACTMFLFFSSSMAQIAPLANERFEEHYSSDVPVSGKVLVGIVAESKKVNSRFFVRLAAKENAFCFRATSIDGTYASENQYILPPELIESNDKNLTEIEYPTQFEQILKAFNDTELALLATEGVCEKSSEAHFIATTDQLNEEDNIRFLISSARSQVFMRLKNDNGNVQANCARIEEGKRTAYDTICEVPLAKLTEAFYQADIIMRRSNRSLPKVSFKLVMKSFDE